jgi:hypothetical protein
MAESIFRKQRRGRAFWLFLPLLLLLYLLLFPRPAGKETLMRPIWATELNPGASSSGNAGLPIWPFQAGESFGYADLSGEIYYLDRRLHNLSLSEIGFINYGSVPDHVVFMNPRGEFQFSIRSYGYPLLESSGQVLYSINTDRSGLKRIDSEGEILWSKSFPTLLTTIAPVAEQCLVGLMDGRALLIDADGKVTYRYSAQPSRIPVLLGAAVSGDQNQIALISGIGPQTLVLVQRRAEEFVQDFRQELDSDYRREVQLRFSPDARFLFYEVDGGLSVLDVRKKSGARFLTNGVLESIDSSLEFTAATFRLESATRLLIFRPLDSLLLLRALSPEIAPETASGLSAEGVYVKVMGSALILGFDGVLLRADLVED